MMPYLFKHIGSVMCYEPTMQALDNSKDPLSGTFYTHTHTYSIQAHTVHTHTHILYTCILYTHTVKVSPMTHV